MWQKEDGDDMKMTSLFYVYNLCISVPSYTLWFSPLAG